MKTSCFVLNWMSTWLERCHVSGLLESQTQSEHQRLSGILPLALVFHEYAYQRGYFNAGIDFFTVAAKSAQLPAEMWCEHPFPLSDAPFRHHCALGNDPYAEYLYSMYGHSASIGRCMAAWTGVIISSCADCAGVLGDFVDWMLLMWYA